jgi:hypothetical protein
MNINKMYLKAPINQPNFNSNANPFLNNYSPNAPRLDLSFSP